MTTVGTLIGGYRLLVPFGTQDAGNGRWAFAERDGREYFIKEFLQPKYPSASSPGMPEGKARRRAECEAFEAFQARVREALQRAVGGGGLLVPIVDVFRVGPRYYKVTDKVDVSGLTIGEIARLPLRDRLTMMLTAVHGLGVVHDQNLVHGDLKPPNILIKRTETSYSARLIDFDASYFGGAPPAYDVIQGDFAYYSPEFLAYVHQRGTAESMTTASDIFSLGVVFHEYLTGEKPRFDGADGHYACQQVAQGGVLRVPGRAGEGEAHLWTLLRDMLRPLPGERPSAPQIKQRLRSGATASPSMPPARPMPPVPPLPRVPPVPRAEDPPRVREPEPATTGDGPPKLRRPRIPPRSDG
jgi:serine/threonine protein kinase